MNTPNKQIKELDAKLNELEKQLEEKLLKRKLSEVLIEDVEQQFSFQIKNVFAQTFVEFAKLEKISIAKNCILFGYSR